jgi:hypothetical protein
VPEAGACLTCRFRAGNNPEEYGEVFDAKRGGVDRCMHPQCYDQKVAAHRERLLQKHATGEKIALAPEENARVFPREERGIHFASEFVEVGAKPTPDLLKKEVSPAAAPTWRELIGAGKVAIYVGVDQDGRAVDLVKRDEAIAAADLGERKIFNETQVKRGTVAKPGKADSASDAANRAAQEKSEKQAREKAERARRKRERLAREWLGQLSAAIVDSGEAVAGVPAAPVWHRLTLWTLIYEAAADTLTPEELAFVVDAVDPDGDAEASARTRLDAYGAEVRLPQFVALCARLIIAPKLLAEGPDGPTAKAWHESIVLAENDRLHVSLDESAATGGQVDDAERAELTQIVQAHAGGMSVVKIARTFGKSLTDVCGMLEVPEHLVRAERDNLDDELSKALHAAGVKPAAIAPTIQGLLGANKIARADLAPEELVHLIERLGKLVKRDPAVKEFPETVEEARVSEAARRDEQFEALATDTFAGWWEEIFVGTDEESGADVVLDREQAAEVITAIVAEEDRTLVDKFTVWVGSNNRLRQAGAAWLEAQLHEAIAKRKKGGA